MLYLNIIIFCRKWILKLLVVVLELILNQSFYVIIIYPPDYLLSSLFPHGFLRGLFQLYVAGEKCSNFSKFTEKLLSPENNVRSPSGRFSENPPMQLYIQWTVHTIVPPVVHGEGPSMNLLGVLQEKKTAPWSPPTCWISQKKKISPYAAAPGSSNYTSALWFFYYTYVINLHSVHSTPLKWTLYSVRSIILNSALCL